MTLDDFIADTLTAIAKGIANAADRVTEHGAIVNPGSDSSFGHDGQWDSKTGSPVQNVSFDVAVASAGDKSTAGGIGIIVGAITLGSTGKSSTSDTKMSRIQFIVPMVIPQTITTEHGDGGNR